MAVVENREKLCSSCSLLPPLKDSPGDVWTSFQDFKSSALNGCPLCAYLYNIQRAEWERVEVVHDLNPGPPFSLNWNGQPPFLPSAVNIDQELTMEPALDLKDLTRYGNYGGPRHSVSYSIFASPDEPISKTFSAREIDPNPMSDRVFAKIHGWIKSCSKHSACDPINEAVLPRFVIDIHDSGATPSLRIFENDKSRKKALYIVLSYVWGIRPQPVQLMKDNMKQLKESIDYETLPKTIQDVIRVAQGLGVRYVWVDALCIVQDDEKVKRQQIDQMKNIYGNSYFAVQAANVNTVMESFLKPRDLPKPFKLRYDECSHIYLRGYTPDRFPKGLARKRAWVFQESVLPNRLLSYGEDQIIFQCREEAQWEDGFRSNRQDSYSPSLLSPRDWRRDYSGSRLDQPTPPPNRRLDFLAAWYTAVDQYTSRALTYPGDRLPAISGAALRLQEEIGGRYVAGMWESDLPWGLLWESKNTMRYPRTKPAMWKMSRPVTSRAQSWSWVAVDGSTKHEFWKRHNDTREQAPVASVSMQSFQVDTVGDIINNGMLGIAAPLFYTSVVLKTNSRYKPYGVSGVKPLLVWDALEKEGWVMPGTDRPTAIANFDIQDEQVLHSGVWCLLICRTVALMLECVDEEKRIFRRLGTCYVIPKFWPSRAISLARDNVFII